MRYILIAIFVLLLGTGLIYAIIYNQRAGLNTNTPVNVQTPGVPSQQESGAFDGSGTLTYQPNNLGTEVPYLVYKAGGETITKALVFDSLSRCQSSQGNFPCALIVDSFSHYYGGGPVHVAGTVNAEHILVDSVSG